MYISFHLFFSGYYDTRELFRLLLLLFQLVSNLIYTFFFFGEQLEFFGNQKKILTFLFGLSSSPRFVRPPFPIQQRWGG
jgi:hypothetical protein